MIHVENDRRKSSSTMYQYYPIDEWSDRKATPLEWKCEGLTSNAILIKIVSVKVLVLSITDCHASYFVMK